MIPHGFALFEAIILLFVYDNLDLLTVFARLTQANLSYLKDKAFYTYFGSRALLSFITWALMTAQEQPLVANDTIMGIIIFLVQIGVIQNFTIRFGKYDFSVFKEFSKARQGIIDNMEDRVSPGQLQASHRWDLYTELEQKYSLIELDKHLHRAYIFKGHSPSQTQKEVAKFKEKLRKSRLSDDVKKSFYTSKLVFVGGTEFAERLIKENQN